MGGLKWKCVNPNSWVRVCAVPCATPPTPAVPLLSTYISFWYWHHFLMPKAIRKLQKRSRTATIVGQGKRLAFAFFMPPGRDTWDRAQPNVLRRRREIRACCLWVTSSPGHSTGDNAAPNQHLTARFLGWGSQTLSAAALICELSLLLFWLGLQADVSHPSVHRMRLFRHSLATVSSKTHWFSLFPHELLWEEEPCHGAARHRCLPQPSFSLAYFSRCWHQTLMKHLARGAAAFWRGLLLVAQHLCLTPAASPHHGAGIPPLPRSCTATLRGSGGWKRCPWGPGCGEEGEEEHGPLTATVEGAAMCWVPERAGAQESLGETSVTSHCAGVMTLCKVGYTGTSPSLGLS